MPIFRGPQTSKPMSSKDVVRKKIVHFNSLIPSFVGAHIVDKDEEEKSGDLSMKDPPSTFNV